MDIHYGQLESLRCLWFVAFVAILSVVALILHHRAQRRFATPGLLIQLISKSSLIRKLSSITATILALIAIVVALVDIRWGKQWQEVPQRGIEVIFLLDVSRSMLAEDTAPNRLGRAKQCIQDAVNQMSGDRVGLVLFAGSVRRFVPLTSHYEDFKQSLDAVGPHHLDRGGSNLGEAISIAADSFLEKTADHKAIVLITDGEDHDSKPMAAARKARDEKGVRIYTVGLGDFDQGARIPIRLEGRGSSFLQYRGQQVWSKLNGQVLQQIADATDGLYIPAGIQQVDMGEVYRRISSGMDKREFDSARINTFIPRYPWPLGAALILLLVDTFISTWPHSTRRHATGQARSF